MVSDPVEERPLEQLSVLARAVEGTVLVVICVLSLFSNLMVWVTILRYGRSHSIVSVFLLSLSTTDILEAAVIMTLTTHSVIMGKWSFNCAVCKVMGFFMTLTLFAKLTGLTALAFNRYIRICRASWYTSVYRKTFIGLHILAVWITAFVWALGPMLELGKYGYVQLAFLCNLDFTISPLPWIIATAVMFVCMLVIVVCCYIAIFYKLSRIKQQAVTITAMVVPSDQQRIAVIPKCLTAAGLSLQQSGAGWAIINGQLIGKRLSAIEEVTDSELTNDIYSCTRSSKEITTEATTRFGSSLSQPIPSRKHGSEDVDRGTGGTRSVKTDRDSTSGTPPERVVSATVISVTKPPFDNFSKASSAESDEKLKNKCKKRFVTATLCLIVIFWISIVPIFHFTFLDKSANISSATKVFFIIVLFANSMLGPIFYAWGSLHIRTGYKLLYREVIKSVKCTLGSQVEPR